MNLETLGEDIEAGEKTNEGDSSLPLVAAEANPDAIGATGEEAPVPQGKPMKERPFKKPDFKTKPAPEIKVPLVDEGKTALQELARGMDDAIGNPGK